MERIPAVRFDFGYGFIAEEQLARHSGFPKNLERVAKPTSAQAKLANYRVSIAPVIGAAYDPPHEA